MKHLLILLLLPSLLLAAPQAAITIAHKPIGIKELPPAGSPLVLSAELQRTRDVDRAVRLILVSDGKSIDVPLLRSYLNDKDRPVYEFQTASPLAEVSYQFYLIDQSGTLASTQRYTLRRACIPNTTLTNTNIDPELKGNEQLIQLVNKADSLEQEFKQYEGTLSSLTEIEKLLKDQK